MVDHHSKHHLSLHGFVKWNAIEPTNAKAFSINNNSSSSSNSCLALLFHPKMKISSFASSSLINETTLIIDGLWASSQPYLLIFHLVYKSIFVLMINNILGKHPLNNHRRKTCAKSFLQLNFLSQNRKKKKKKINVTIKLRKQNAYSTLFSCTFILFLILSISKTI